MSGSAARAAHGGALGAPRRAGRKGPRPRLIVLALVSAALIAACAPARPAAQERKRVNRDERDAGVAAGLMRQGRYGEASRLLEHLCAERPDLAAAELLAECYMKTGRAGLAVDLLEVRIAQNPGHFPFIRLLGHAHLDLGERERAVEAWRGALGGDPRYAKNFALVGRLMMEAGLYEEAVEVYRSGRMHEALYRPMTAEIIRLERLLGNPEAAFRETVRLIASGPALNVGDVKLLADIYAESGRDERLLAIADSAAAESESARFDIARAVLLLEAGRYGEAERYVEGRGALADREFYAFIRYLSVERKERGERGFLVFRRKALEAFLDLYPESPVAPEVMIALAESLREEAHLSNGGCGPLERALETIGLVKHHRLGGPFRERAAILEAEILLDDLHRPHDALAAIEDAGVPEERSSTRAEEIRMAALVRAGAWEKVERRAALLEAGGDSAKAAVGLYGRGTASFYRGDYEEAVELLSSVAESCPWSPWANDALETALLVEEALRGGAEPLDRYRDAAALAARGDLAGAADSLEALIERFPSSPLRPRALFERAELDMRSGNGERAERGLETIAELYPLSDLAPRALELLARRARDEDPRRAEELYETILERYPDDPFLERVRRAYISLRRSAGKEE